jgi:thiol-disulfide isomerase/thioredoxin
MDEKQPWGILSLILLGLVVGAGIGAYLLILNGYLHLDWFDQFVGNSSQASIQVNKPVPDFEFVSMSGDPVHLDDLKGKPILVNFWATWCAPCKLEMPLIQAFADKYADELVVLPINADDDPAAIQKFIDELRLTMPVYVDKDGKVESLFHILGLPTTYFIDREGNLKKQHVGVMTEEQLHAYLVELGVAAQ